MNLHLKQGYYKDIRACEEIARDSVLYERYFCTRLPDGGLHPRVFSGRWKRPPVFCRDGTRREGRADGHQPQRLHK